MVENHACHVFEPKSLLDYKVLKIINDSTLLLITTNGKERKTNITHVTPCSTTWLVENAWDSFPGLIKAKYQNCSCNLRS